LEVTYAADPEELTRPETLETSTIAPFPCSANEGSAARASRSAAVTFTSRVRFHDSSATSPAAPPNATAAFAITMSSRPNESSVALTSCATSAGSGR